MLSAVPGRDDMRADVLSLPWGSRESWKCKDRELSRTPPDCSNFKQRKEWHH